MKSTIQQQAALAEFKFLQSVFGNKSAVAELMGLNRSTVGRWHRHQPDHENATKVTALRLVYLKLQELYGAETAEKWLLGINAFLRNQRPIDALKQGRYADVLLAIEQEEAGGYA